MKSTVKGVNRGKSVNSGEGTFLQKKKRHATTLAGTSGGEKKPRTAQVTG